MKDSKDTNDTIIIICQNKSYIENYTAKIHIFIYLRYIKTFQALNNTSNNIYNTNTLLLI